MKNDHLFYYSINSYLAYHINELFYNHVHYVWCSPVFDSRALDQLHPWRKIPQTSNPCEIYEDYKKAAERGDLHFTKIKENRKGIMQGAIFHKSKGNIDDEDVARINQMVKNASLPDFAPLLYLIPKQLVLHKVETVAVKKTANPLGVEYRLSELHRNEFDIIRF